MDLKLWQEIDQNEPIPEHILKRMEELRQKGAILPEEKYIKRPTMIEGIRKASLLNKQVLDEVEKHIHVGMSTQEIDNIVKDFTEKNGGICAPYHYEGFPKHVCTSINSVVCHGIPKHIQKLHDGDIVNVDCTTIVDGYYGDASRMFCIGNVSEERRKLVEETKKCLEIGLAAAQPWNTVGDIGSMVIIIPGTSTIPVPFLPTCATNGSSWNSMPTPWPPNSLTTLYPLDVAYFCIA